MPECEFHTLSVLKHLKTKILSGGGPWCKMLYNSNRSNLCQFRILWCEKFENYYHKLSSALAKCNLYIYTQKNYICKISGRQRHHWHVLVSAKWYFSNQWVLEAVECFISLVGWVTHVGFPDIYRGWRGEMTMTALYFVHMAVYISAHPLYVLYPPILCPVSVLKQYVVSIDGNNPFIKWQMEKGLDWTISSVAGESYSVDVSRSL